MTASLPTAPSPTPLSAPSASEINVSCRLPLLVLFVSAAIWLVIASAFGLIGSLKFHSPNLLADTAWLTYGRVRPAYLDSLLYGFCLQAGLGVGLWIFAQAGRTTLVQPWLVSAGAAFWNLAVTIGVVGILLGDGTGFEHLDLPGYSAPFLSLGYLMLGGCALLTFHRRRERQLSAAQWFLFTAWFWFIWIYSTAELLLITYPVRGVVQPVIAWWYANNLTFVWIGLVGLATAFYLLPRLAGRKEPGTHLPLFTYWTFILFAGWGGIPNSAPVPAWMPALSTVATVLTLVSLLGAVLVIRQGRAAAAAKPPTSDEMAAAKTPSQFIQFGVLAFLCAGLMRILHALPGVSDIVEFTWFSAATSQLQVYGFGAMVLLGALYYILPQLTGAPFPSAKLVRAHWWLAALGVVFTVVPWAFGGILEGFKLQQQPVIAFVDIVKSTLPFLRVSTLGDLFIAVGHVLFLVNALRLVNAFYLVRAESAYADVTADLFKPAGARP